MKFLLFVLFAAICAGYFVVNREVQKDVNTSIEKNLAILGMTEAEAKKSLGEPLATKTTKSFWGSEVVMTFGDGNEITFRRGKATKIQFVQLNPALLEVKKAIVVKKEIEAGRATPEAKHGAWMWKNYKNPLDYRPGK